MTLDQITSEVSSMFDTGNYGETIQLTTSELTNRLDLTHTEIHDTLTQSTPTEKDGITIEKVHDKWKFRDRRIIIQQ